MFDGALPKTKQCERIGRNDRYNNQVNGFRANYPSETCPRPTPLGSTSYSFLAPALREALDSSEYASLTCTVPGEADDWCASYANTYPSAVIFSDDTDLLLYGFPREMRIIYFKDTELWPEPKFKGYCPARICQDLELTSLGAYAYLLSKDIHQPERKLIEEAKCIGASSTGYSRFIERYTAINAADLLNTQRAKSSMQNLDVRVSEMVHQSMSLASAPVVYLPFLVEDKHRSSAWNIGQDLRTISYSLLTRTGFAVQEHRRKAQKVTAQEIRLFGTEELNTTIHTYAESIRAWLEWTNARRVPGEAVWPLYAVGMVLPEIKTAPSLVQMIRILNADFDNTWNFIHLTACLHAGLYSLRMLKQCIDVFLTLNEDGSTPLLPVAAQLQSNLQSMGTITELFVVPGQAKTWLGDQDVLRELLASIYASANVEVPTEQKSNKRLKKQQREAERKGKRRQEGGNVFNVLEFMNTARRN